MYKFNSKKISNNPGVYLFKDEKSNIIYVGKAKNLRHRVSSYFIKNNDRLYKKHLIVDSIDDIETIITNSEKEALILESNLIKKYRPKYNVLLKDNSEYCFLKIDCNKKLYVPEISIVRRKTEEDFVNKKKNTKDITYFGPYTSKKDLLSLLKIISKIFPYQCLKIKNLNKIYSRDNKNVLLSPCFNYYIKRCAGICCGEITKEEYRETINSIIDFFSGNIKELEDYLNSKMKEYSEKKNYEQALDYKNKIELLENIINRQNVRDISNNDIDILSVYIYSKLAVVNVFSIVKGVLLNKQNFIVQTNNFIDWYDDVGDEYKQNIITEFVKQNYINSISNNKTIVIYDDKYIDKEQLIGLNVKIRKYKTKSELGLIEMGEKNCESYINKEQINFVVLEKIKNKINLDKIPKRIECFDISNIQGKYAVGSMSVFIDGLPSKDNYRKFKIRMKNEPDDPMMMREVLGRRLSKKNLTEWGVPDLIVIDGGLTQLGAVLRAFNESKKNIEINKILSKIEIVSLAKKEEEVFYYKDGDIKKVSGKDLYILRQIRDEAHRFGIGYFRNRYRKQFSLQNK